MIRNIRTAFQSAAEAAIAELDWILARIEEIKNATAAMVGNVTAPPPDGGPPPEEPGEPGQGATAAGWESGGSYIDLRGATIFGYDEFTRRIAEAQAQNARRSGLLVPA